MSLLYNSPKLFDRSDCIVESFSINEKKQRYVLFSTFTGLEIMKAFIPTFEKKYEWYVMLDHNQASPNETSKQDRITYLPIEKTADIMKKQKVGTQLYIAGDWKMVKEAFTFAIEAGFIEEEIQVYIVGEKERHTYCPSCYTLTAIQEEEEEFRCPSCNVMLVISPFYSKVRDGYLGYPYVD